MFLSIYSPFGIYGQSLKAFLIRLLIHIATVCFSGCDGEH